MEETTTRDMRLPMGLGSVKAIALLSEPNALHHNLTSRKVKKWKERGELKNSTRVMVVAMLTVIWQNPISLPESF